MNLLEELEGNGWSIQQALLTSYPFDPQFFSGYVRPRLGKRNCDLPLVLMDSNRYEQNITNRNWREAPMGTDYLLEPIYSDGVFHPKVNLYASERSVYYSVSSANLGLEEYCKAAQIGTSGGFQKFWLTDEEHTVGEEYLIAQDIRSFFENLLELEDYVTGQDARDYIRQTATTLDWLDESEPSDLDSERTTWFLSNLTDSILEQVVNQVGDIDAVQMYAPFYGTPSVLQRMVEAMDASRLEFIVESESTAIDVSALPDTLEIDFAVREMKHSTTRWVHAKFMTLEGDWGTACLYGSPNMTSTALLEPATRGNVEAGILQVFSDGQSQPLDDSLFHNTSFPFELSEPVDDLSSLTLRTRSYEGWETTTERDSRDIRLRDAQLTKPDSDDESELILRLGGVSGEHSFVIKTEDGIEHRLMTTIDEDNELSILLDAEAHESWVDAVVTVSIPSEERESNTRQVIQETQDHYREYRDITRSDGTQSSTTLLRTVLQNPDTNAAGVFNIAISELRRTTQQASSEPATRAPDGEGAPQFPERSPTRLAGSSSSAPSLPTLISKHLTYQRDRAVDLLTSDERPTPEMIERFLDHLNTFWETIELCLVMDSLGELNSDAANDQKLFKICRKELSELMSELPTIVRRLNGIIDRIENESETQTEFLTKEAETIDDLSIWTTVFNSLFFHPGILIELDCQTGRDVTAPRHLFAAKLKSALTIANPAIWQHLYDGSYIVPQSRVQVENLQVDYGEEQSLSITNRGIQAISLYLFIQQVTSNPNFIRGLQNHPRFSQEDIEQIAEFAINGQGAIVEYGLVGRIQLQLTLGDALNRIQEV